jgi:glycosyltransferase involved in cell wall biosynthesis
VIANLIVLNGGINLTMALDSIRPWVDRILVGVDDRTDDDTVERLEAAQVEFQFFSFTDFAVARNLVLAQVPDGEWVFVLDADEVMLPRHGELLRSVAEEADAQGIDLVLMIRRWWLDAQMTQEIKPPNWPAGFHFPDWMARLFKMLPSVRYEGQVHEQPVGWTRHHFDYRLEIQHLKIPFRPEDAQSFLRRGKTIRDLEGRK